MPVNPEIFEAVEKYRLLNKLHDLLKKLEEDYGFMFDFDSQSRICRALDSSVEEVNRLSKDNKMKAIKRLLTLALEKIKKSEFYMFMLESIAFIVVFFFFGFIAGFLIKSF